MVFGAVVNEGGRLWSTKLPLPVKAPMLSLQRRKKARLPSANRQEPAKPAPTAQAVGGLLTTQLQVVPARVSVPVMGLCSARCSHAGAQQRRCSSACDGLLPGVDTECARPAQAAMRPNAFRTRSERRPHYQAPPKRPRYTTPAGADALKPLPSTCARSQRTPPPSR